jgi:hypothetical protein
MHYAFLLKKIFRVLLVHENLCLVKKLRNCLPAWENSAG